MRNGAPLMLDASTRASNPARARINLLRYASCYPTWPLLWAALLISSAWLTVAASLWFLALAFAVLGCTVLYWIMVREYFLYGDANPGVVVGLKPTLIAVR